MLRFYSRAKRPFWVLLLLLAFWLRLHQIDALSFWTDEGLTPLRAGYAIAEILSNRIIIQQGLTNDTHPPLYYLLIHFTRQLFGETDFAFRYPSLLCGILLPPVVYQLGRRLHGAALGAPAALLIAVNPLHIWYAHEARMYPLAVLLMALASYQLWPLIVKPAAAQRPFPILRHLLLYLLFAGLALYTHYTAVFLIAAHALFWIWWLWQRGQRRLIIGAAIVGLLAAAPLIPYTVPRLFRGVEANFFYVSPLIMLQDVVRFFSLGVTADFKLLGVRLLATAAGLLALLGVYAAGRWRTRLFLLAYLLAIVLGLMAGSLIKPMYQGARHIMLGSPAFSLLLAWGLLWLWQTAVARRARAGWALLALWATAVTLIAPAYALDNLYNNPRYGKDNFRDLIRFVELHAGDRDLILYHNAILLPLHDHYQQRTDLPVAASPIYPTHAADTAVPQLEALAQQYDRIWFVTDPPADKRDETDIVPNWLEAQTTRIETYPFPARTTSLEARVYDTGLTQTEATPLSQSWSGLPTLQGVIWRSGAPAAAPGVWLDLVWAHDAAPPPQTELRVDLIGPDDHIWLRSTQPLQRDELAVRWQEPGATPLPIQLALPVGLPPGDYTLTVQPVVGGAPVGEPTALGDLPTAGIVFPPHAWQTLTAGEPAVQFANGLTLRGIATPDTAVRPGHALPLHIFWEMERPLDPNAVTYQLDVLNAAGDVIRTQQARPGAAWLSDWPAAQPLREQTGLYFPPETPPGQYRLRWQLLDSATGQSIAGRPSWQPWDRDTHLLGAITVIPWPLEINLPPQLTPLSAQFGESIRLAGYTVQQTADALALTLAWRAQSRPTDNYFAFVHLVDENGAIVSQSDRIPADGLRPTSGWRPNEVIVDVHRLSLPPDLPPSQYALRVGLYLPQSFERPLVTVDGDPQPDNQITLTKVTLP